ncbi:MAG: hypothetical protein EOP45_18555 [Sphingobacteriaceae bacterium]|nr:MAG: hypothetical protein EOP45_18555 [Sphingobacteriaceae bacterium]
MNKVLEKFFVCSPEKYYSKEAYITYFDFLTESLIKNKVELLQFFTDKKDAINMSCKLLDSINSKPIHEYQVKDTDAVFIDEYINYGYLQLLEGVLLVYVQLVTYIELINEGKKTDNLDLFTCIEKLGKGRFGYLKFVYDNTVRNGIGHGKIVYGESKAEYIDKKDNKATFYYYQLIRKFDSLLDIINGFVLAYITFWSKELNSLNIELPRQLIFEEVRLNSTLPHWQVTNVINQQILDKRQLSITIRSSCSLQTELRDHAIKTAVHAAHLVGDKFDIIELHITHNDFPGYVKFDVKLLNELDGTSLDSASYSSTVVDSLEMFFSGFTNVMPASMDSNYFRDSPAAITALFTSLILWKSIFSTARS